MQVHTYDAEMGRTGGGVMNMTARSGTNQWRGSGYTVHPPRSAGRAAADSEAAGPAERAASTGATAAAAAAARSSRTRRSSGSPARSTSTTSRSRARSSCRRRPSCAATSRGLTRNGAPVDHQATRSRAMPFPGNIIPAEPDGSGRREDRRATCRRRTRRWTTASSNFSMTDLLPNQAYQFTTKVDHHFNDAVALSGFVPAPGDARGELELQPGEQVRRRAATSSIAAIDTFVLNNTYVMNTSTVLTLRGGYNKFDDNYNLPAAVRRRRRSSTTRRSRSQMSDTNRFPTTSITGYKGTGWTNRQANGYYQYGVNGTLEQAGGLAQLQVRRRLPRRSACSRSTTARRPAPTPSPAPTAATPLADMLLGYPQSGNIPLERAARWLRQLLRRLRAGRLARQRPADAELRPPPRARDRACRRRTTSITVDFDQTAVSPLEQTR